MTEAFSRHTDPQTSHDAAKTVDVTECERKVLAAIRKGGAYGMTWDELVLATGLPRQSISPRLKPLHFKGLIVYSYNPNGSIFGRPGMSGRRQNVHFPKGYDEQMAEPIDAAQD